MRRTLVLGLALALTGVAHAYIALDNASNNPPYVVGEEYIQVGTTPGDQTAAINGLNGGYGFEKWQRGGYGSPTSAGSTLITAIDASYNMGTQQFGMRSAPNGSEGADARRRMLNDLGIGETLSFSMMAGGNGAGTEITSGFFGVELRGSALSNPGRDMISINGASGANWGIDSMSGTTATNIAVTPGLRLDVSVKMLGLDQFDVTLTPWGGLSESHVVAPMSQGVMIRTAQFYVYNTNGDFYLNNLAAVPEPTTMVALAAGAAFLLKRRRR